MFLKVQRDTMRASYAEILEVIKCSDGMPISDLSRELGMSYMGVKQHCLNLTERGYLVEWRVPREKRAVGRPEKLYRLTKKADPLFPQAEIGLTLAIFEGARQLYGESAPEKLLFHHFQELRDQWQAKVRTGKSLVEKATRLTDLRDKQGWFSRCHYDPETGFRIEEFHNPLAEIYAKYPNAVRMEVQMMEQVLGTKVIRNEASVGKGRKRVVYEIATLGMRSEEKASRPIQPEIRAGGQGQLF
ncbi:MAG: winged helix-turn-helix transcriptional regulator [Akkermansiaceae bacterium]|nr:winged helix-turn-helix transcriptional regulator [Akkermansiaceae bacterium]